MLNNPVFQASFAKRLGFPLDVGRGTLWWVRERQWRKVLPREFRNPDRDRHPALSIFREDHIPMPAERIPVLFGRSRKEGKAVVVRGLSAERGELHETYFKYIRPNVAFAYATFDQEENVDADTKLPPIWPNRHKSRVTDEEMTDLLEFLRKRDLL